MVQLIPACGAASIVLLVAAFGGAVAQADFAVPAPGLACSAPGAMTVLPNGSDFLICQEQGAELGWAPVTAPFPANDSWLSYGPEITLHGQGVRNPNLEPGEWSANPLDPTTQCGASQVAVVGPGTLAPAQTVQADPGQPLSLQVLSRLHTIALTGDCLWTKQPG